MTRNTVNFVQSDNNKALFPLKSTERYITLGASELKDLIYNDIFSAQNAAASFTVCPIAHALKDNLHLRRMIFLDPIASFYIYDFLLKNNQLFQVDTRKNKRQYYGYNLKKQKATKLI